MVRLRVTAKRPTPLEDLSIVEITNFNTAFDIDIYTQEDDNPPELYEKITFAPDTSQPEPQPPEPPIEDDVLYDSHINSKLHDGKSRTIEKEGDISPGGLGVECRASGDPVIVVNTDGTFSLKCKEGHGRFYLYCLNYNATLEIECAFWNEVKGQDLSLKMRSRHNEDGDEESRFGGYGLSIDREGWGAKREPYHNTHDQSTSGDLPFDVKTQKYFTIRQTVKDEGGKVTQIGEMNGKQFMKKVDDKPKDYMVDEPLYNKQSYCWIRSNIEENKTGEIRIKRLRILKA
ncbi:MAG TPA: hypothetical protein VGE97_02480 [Nitrososphaera sp.]